MAQRRNKTEQETPRTAFAWTAQRERAAVLLAEDNLTDEQIAAELHIGRTTLHRWKEHPEFQSRVSNQVEEIRAAVAMLSISDKTHRVEALNDRWQRMRRVITERAQDPEMTDVPGGQTGLLVRTFKMLGGGESARVVEEYAVDTGLLREIRAHEEQAAKELGQWVERQASNVTGTIGVEHGDSLTPEEREAVRRALTGAGGR